MRRGAREAEEVLDGKLSSSALYVAVAERRADKYTIAPAQPMKSTLRNQLYMDEKFQKRSM